MGIVLNPLALRIGYSQSWGDSWYLNLTEYVEFFYKMLLFKNFVYFLFFRFFSTRKASWLFSHLEVVFKNNILFLNLYLYQAFNINIIGRSIIFLKYRLFKKLRLKTLWMKKHLFHKNIVALLFFFYVYMFLFYDLEKFQLLKNMIFSKRVFDKIKFLRKKFEDKNWLGAEQLEIMRYALRFFYFGINPYSYWVLYDTYKSNFFLPFDFSYLSYEKMKGSKIFMFFFCLLVKFYKESIFNVRSQRLVMSSKIIFIFIKFLHFSVIFLPIFKFFSKFIEYLCSYFLFLNSEVNVFILNNYNLSAKFISRYIMLALKNKFNFYDIINPIKRTLNSFLVLKIFDKLDLKKKTYYRTFVSYFKDKYYYFIVYTMSNIILINKRIFFKLTNYFTVKGKMFNKFSNIFLKNYRYFFKKNIFNVKISLKRNLKFKHFYNSNEKYKFLLELKDIVSREYLEQLKREKRKMSDEKRIQYNIKRRERYKKQKEELKNVALLSEENLKKQKFNELKKYKKSIIGKKNFVNKFFIKSYSKKKYSFNNTKFFFLNFFRFLFCSYFNDKMIFYGYNFYFYHIRFSIINNTKFNKILCFFFIFKFINNEYEYSYSPFLFIKKNSCFRDHELKFRKKLFVRYYSSSSLKKKSNLKNNDLFDRNRYKDFIINIFNNYFFKFGKLSGLKLYMMKLVYDLLIHYKSHMSYKNIYIFRIFKFLNILRLFIETDEEEDKNKLLVNYKKILESLFYILFTNNKVVFELNNLIDDLLLFFDIKELFNVRHVVYIKYEKIIKLKKKFKFPLPKNFGKDILHFDYYFKKILFFNSKFPFSIDYYLNTVKFYNNKKFEVNSFLNSFKINILKRTKKENFGNKNVRYKSSSNEKTFFYGYKFHFVGRFTRKQKSANLWFKRGSLPTSDTNANIDYNMHTLTLRFSACTLKIWLYKGFYASNFYYKYIFNEN